MRHAANAAVQLDATRGDAHFHAGIHEITSSHKEATIAAAHRWLDFAPKSALAHFWMGSTLAANCRMSDAIVYLQQAARLQPYATCFQTWFAVALFCTGRTDAGLRHLRDILAFEPHDYLANYWLGLLATHARRYDEARDAAYRAHEVSGNPRRSPGWGSSRRHHNVSKRPRRSSSRSLTRTRPDTWRGQVSARSTPRLDAWIAPLESGRLLGRKETGNWAGHRPTHAGTHCEERSLASDWPLQKEDPEIEGGNPLVWLQRDVVWQNRPSGSLAPGTSEARWRDWRFHAAIRW